SARTNAPTALFRATSHSKPGCSIYPARQLAFLPSIHPPTHPPASTLPSPPLSSPLLPVYMFYISPPQLN
ncbi:hypothetical protein ACTXT7_017499, partial [Hymenolepis weldensis]